MKKVILAILLLLLLFITASIFTVKLVQTATTWYVDPLGTDDASHGTGTGASAFKTIQYAVTQASDLDTINVAAGTYNEEVDVTKALSIIGAGAATTTITGAGLIAGTPVVTIDTTGSVVFSGFTITGAPPNLAGDSFGMLAKQTVANPAVTYTISDCKFVGTNNPSASGEFQFYESGGQEAVVFTRNVISQYSGNAFLSELHAGATEISYNIFDAPLCNVDPADVIFFMTYGGTNVNTLQNICYNIFNMGTANLKSTAVSISAPGFGSGNAQYTNVVVTGNTFKNLLDNGRAVGFWADGGNNIVSPVVTKNLINGVPGSVNSYGINFYDSSGGTTSGATISCNTISGMAEGIYLRVGDAPLTAINDNDLAGNTVGLDWTGSGIPTSVDATNNWWGSPAGPALGYIVDPGGVVTYNPVAVAVPPCAPPYTFTVNSAYGSPNPSVGAHTENPGLVTASVTSPVTVGLTQYVCTGWTGTGDVPPSGSGTTVTFTITQDSSITWNWKTQYFLTVSSAYDTPGGGGWYDSGSTAYATLTDGTVSGGAGTQYVFTGWSTDASGTNYAQSDAITMDAAKTATADWKTQYQVTFGQTGVGSDFSGTMVTVDGTDYDRSGASFWWDESSDHSFSFASPLVVSVLKQYLWSSTSGLSSLQNDPLTVTASGSVVGNYIPSNAITFDQLGLGSDFTGTVVTVDGTPYTLPVSFYWTIGSSHSFAFQSPLVITANVKQYLWTSTTGLSSLQSGSITVTTYGSIVGHYKTQYYLTVSSYSGLVPPPAPASGWFDAGSQVTLTAPQEGHDLQGTLFTFHGIWTVIDASINREIQGNTVQITMNSSTLAIAWYVDPPAFGDVNDDGRVDLTDVVLVAHHYGTGLGNPSYSYLYDLNGDGRINLIDLAAVARALWFPPG